MTDWKAKYNEINIDYHVRGAERFYGKYGDLLLKYSGGMPAGFLAAIAQWESGGSITSKGDASLGETGFFQLESSLPKKFCMPDVRSDPAGNIWLGCMEYNAVANRLNKDRPAYVWNGTAEQWKMARLCFAIGYAGALRCLDASNPIPGLPYSSIVSWADRTGAMSLGSQESGKVWYRIKAINKQWLIGSRVGSMAFGVPREIPKFNGQKYCYDTDVYGNLFPGGTNLVFAAVVVGAAIYLRDLLLP